MPDISPQFFARRGIDVSRETCDKLARYHELLIKWQRAINLISNETLDEAVERHFLDSAQLIKHIPNLNIKMGDMGSGGGFPGLVLAIMGVAEVHLIESDVRKATFLREVARETGTKVFVHDDRVETVKVENLDLITARALAPLKDLLTMADQLATKDHVFSCLFMKGEKTEEELEKARKRWSFDLVTEQSITDKSGKILKISNLTDK